MKRLLASLLFSSLFAACGGDDDGASPGDSGGDDDGVDPAALTYHRDVKPIVDAKCAGCHTDGGIAPFPLQSYADFEDCEGMVRVAVEDRIMPPWLAADGCNDYRADRSLTDDQIATIVDWVDQGAPEGDAAEEGEPLEVEDVRLSRVDVTLEMPVDYTAQMEPDDYRCFLLDWPEDTRSS